MSNTARKARKRAGQPFARSPKTSPIKSRSAESQFRNNAEARAQFAAGLRAGKQDQPVKSETFVEVLPMDPKPYRVGRKRYSYADAWPILNGEDSQIMPSEIILSPRKGYNQDKAAY